MRNSELEIATLCQLICHLILMMEFFAAERFLGFYVVKPAILCLVTFAFGTKL